MTLQTTSAGAKRLALFDLDHTLIPLDSDHAWGEFTTALGWTDATEFKRQNDAFYEHYKAGTLDVPAYVRFATAAIVRQGAIKSIAAHAEFMGSVIQKGIKPQALELVQAHQRAGDTVIVVTATNAFVTRPIAKAFGVDELIAVDLAMDSAPGGTGWYNGEIAGIPSFREGKVTRVSQWLTAHGLDWSQVHTTFYSDSLNDLPLLEKVTVPVATNPDARLRALAQERGWRILELFP
ncbi:HAD family hydrolase [Rhodoferax sp.]|uniref:histidinol-phosphatase n=1 Tax=Rhodoferax sp. TaxID=50421 RepID=UPI002ACDE71B|nr:HAD family hydrolase [Rhodoferax sp.]MDZ7921566.1 HAD family hydrolase [Rhodoferax sp.]